MDEGVKQLSNEMIMYLVKKVVTLESQLQILQQSYSGVLMGILPKETADNILQTMKSRELVQSAVEQNWKKVPGATDPLLDRLRSDLKDIEGFEN
jgi:hypothetical protein